MTLLEIPYPEGSTGVDEPVHVGQWRLARVELVNWGTFDGHHRVDVSRAGHLFTGASGSGKSSLLDAIATVLTPDRWLRFNAAAQEASTRNDDRSLVSYVRGAWSREADETLDRAVSTYLRKGATWSGILLRYANGRDAPVTLVRLFHLRGASVDKSDLKDLCFADRSQPGLLDLREHVESGIEARRMKSAYPDAVITTTGSHGAFYARMQRLLGLGSPGSTSRTSGTGGQNALQLLHKTQSAKNLGSLDQLFRSFMLDEPMTFARARNAVDQFGELSEAHRHVVELRRQVEHLREIDVAIADYESAASAVEEAERLTGLIDGFQNALTLQLAIDDRGLLRAEQARSVEQSRRADSVRDEAEETFRAAERRAMNLGGSDAAQVQERVADAEKAAGETSRRWARLAEQLTSVGIATAPSTAAEFAELRDSSSRALGEAAPRAAHEHDDNSLFFDAKSELATIDREIAQLRSRKSNLPAALQLARRTLAEELGLSEAALPFAGELIEVLPDYAEWTGAIERVLYPLASALLVRDEHLQKVRRFVEGRNLGTRLVFEAVSVIADPPRPARSERSLLHRITVSDSSFHDWLSSRVSTEFDIACVDHPDDLDRIDRGVTIGGQIKKSARRYEKNDRHRVDDRSQWILGADNAAKIDVLLDRRRDAERRLSGADARLRDAQSKREAATRRRTVLESVVRQDWTELDRAAADERVRARRRQLDALTVGNTRLHGAIQTKDAALARRTEAAEAADTARLNRREIERELATVDSLIAELGSRVGDKALHEADSDALAARYRKVQRKIDRSSIGDVGRKVSNALHGESSAAQERARRAQDSFVRSTSGFASLWPAASADLTTSIEDRAGYRGLLEGIVARGLPDHEGNFRTLLRDKSRDLIGHLLSDIRDAPGLVEDRIAPVNGSLGRSRFDVDRYLRIEVKTRRAPEVTQFMADLKTVADGAWGDEDLAAAERRFAVLDGVMRRLASGDRADVAWARRCLDTREHVAFLAHEVDLTGRTRNVHDSSAGLSGGQRQKLVIFCLAAALRYQLAADEDELPSYATIVLDEAFDKADSRYTRMAMDVFVEFGFHMILATPEKLLQTIEPYVGAVTSITNPSRNGSRTATVLFHPDT